VRRTNAKLPEYCSWCTDPQAKVVDAFSTSWAQDQPYLIPPFNLTGRALSKISVEEVNYACLIAPIWPAQVWYSQVLRMLVRNLILLPMEQDLLLSPDLKPHPLILENWMPMSCLRQAFSTQGFYERVAELLLHSWRSNTHATLIQMVWLVWWNPVSASLGNVLEFLADQFELGLQYHSLNTYSLLAHLPIHNQIILTWEAIPWCVGHV